jgi:hypothetical protein
MMLTSETPEFKERNVVTRRVLVSSSIVVAAVLVGGLVGAIVGVPALSGASPAPTTVPTNNNKAHPMGPGGEIAAAATALGLTPQQLLDKLSDGKTTIADVAAQQHVDINTVIDAMANADRDRIKKIVNSPWPPFGFGHGKIGAGMAPAFGPRFGPRMGFGLGGPMALDAAAKALGMTTQDLATQLRNGSTIAQIAKTKGVDVNNVINAMTAEVNQKIDQAQANGKLSQTEANNAKAKAKDAITNIVNNGLPKGPPMGGWGKPGGFHAKFGGMPSMPPGGGTA